jgi:endonuclease/exonuclease/phosphatase (EEP) superfamily protein YafD
MPNLRVPRTLEAAAVLPFLLQAVRVLFSVLFDFVWTRGLAVRKPQVLDSLASDHRLVAVEVTLRPPAEP